MQIQEGINNSTLIYDTSDLNYESLEKAISCLSNYSVQYYKKTVILSDISQGSYSLKELYEKVNSLLKSNNIHKIVGIGTSISQNSDLFDISEKYFYQTTSDFFNTFSTEDFFNEFILLKGENKSQLEKIIKRLQKKVHQTTLYVDLNALANNFKSFRQRLSSKTKMMCVVKASGYGSGSVEVARTLELNGCDYLAVALVDEGVELRKAGIDLPILVLNPEKTALDRIVEYQLEPEIYNFNILNEFLKYLGNENIVDYPVHIKFDSGMHRLGFVEDDSNQLLGILKNQKQIKISTLFSHLSGADVTVLDDFTYEQIENFTQFADDLSSHFSYSISRHILNSAGIERFASHGMDMVRLGIGLYGLSSIQENNLETVCVLKTKILQIKKVGADETVGYSRSGKLERNSIVAILPIGYADGFNRLLGNGRGIVFINGRRAKTVGNVCMDLTFVDITDVAAKEGDEVEIFGENISILEIAETLNTIPYEVLTSVSHRVRRIYKLK